MLKYWHGPQQSDIGQTRRLTCLLVFRTAESSSKETQEDVHCENGRDKKPVEEYCCALRQLVRVFCISTWKTVWTFTCQGAYLCGRIWKLDRKRGSACECFYVCVGARQCQSDAPFWAVEIALLTWRLDTALIIRSQCFCPSKLYVCCSLFASPVGSLLSPPSETSSPARLTQL